MESLLLVSQPPKSRAFINNRYSICYKIPPIRLSPGQLVRSLAVDYIRTKIWKEEVLTDQLVDAVVGVRIVVRLQRRMVWEWGSERVNE